MERPQRGSGSRTQIRWLVRSFFGFLSGLLAMG